MIGLYQNEENTELQVLLSTMNQKDYKFLEKMNINSEAIVINQTNEIKLEEYFFKENKIKIFSFNEKGVGLSRNNALMRSTSKISLFADDDVEYIDNYKQIILNEFNNNPKADIIIFNVISKNNDRPEYIIKKKHRLNYCNCMRYGTFRIAIRTEKIKENNLYFSLLFGGGAKYSCGEDTLFLIEALKKGLKLYATTEKIGYVNHDLSTWFKGYNQKYFYDKGILFYFISKRFAKILCLQFCIRKRKLFKNSIKLKEAYKIMIEGIESLKK